MSDVKVKEFKEKPKKQINSSFKYSMQAIGLAFVVGLILIIFSGQVLAIPDFIFGLFKFNFGTMDNLAIFFATISWMIPLGLAVAISFRVGVFNIGSVAQFLAGGIASIIFASNVNIGSLGWIFTLLIAIFVGAFVAFIIGILKTRFHIHEVISSIMLNWVFYYILRQCTGMAPGVLDGNSLRFAWLDNLFGFKTDSQFNFGIFIAILILPVFGFLYKKTTWGYKQMLLGNNSSVANYIGLNKNKEIIKTFIISGALAGLAGAIYYVGYQGNLPNKPSAIGSDIPPFAFDGITIALIGFNSPMGVFLGSILIAILSNSFLDGIINNSHITEIMMAIMIIFLSFVQYQINFKQPKIKSTKTIVLSEDENGSKKIEVKNDMNEKSVVIKIEKEIDSITKKPSIKKFSIENIKNNNTKIKKPIVKKGCDK